VEDLLEEIDLADLLAARSSDASTTSQISFTSAASGSSWAGTPRKITSGGATDSPSCSDTVATTTKIPSAESMRRSRRATSAGSPMSTPSTKIIPDCSREPKRAPLPSSSSGSPFSPLNTSSGSTPTASASLACRWMRLKSPWKGIT
jgi:hypothetical protein